MSFKDVFKQKYSSEELMKSLKSEDYKNKYVDERFWKPTYDPKTGTSTSVIRFLPSKHNKVPFVKVFEHSFKGPTGMWYIEKSLTTIGLPDPVSEYNMEEWATEDENRRNAVRSRARKVYYITNIYVINDQNKPENNGKVFLFKFPKTIFEMITKLLDPPEAEIDDEAEPIDPFDLFDGVNFVLKTSRNDGGFIQYKDSFFNLKKRGPLFPEEEEIEKVYNQTYDLSEFTDPANFKSYDELKERFEKVMGLNLKKRVVEEEASEEDEVEEPPKPKKTATSSSTKKKVVDDVDDEELMEIFNKLKKESTNDDDDDVPF